MGPRNIRRPATDYKEPRRSGEAVRVEQRQVEALAAGGRMGAGIGFLLYGVVIVSNIDDPRSIDLHWSSGADFLQGNFIQRPLENMDYDFSQVVI